MTWSNRNLNNTTAYSHPLESNLWELHKAMDYNPAGQPVLRIDDTSLQHTSRDRAKVSNYEVIYFNTFQFDGELDLWDEVVTTGGTSTHDINQRDMDLVIDLSIPGASVARQTKHVMQYVPGRTAETSMSVNLGAGTPGVLKRIGIFDENNGLFLEQDGDQLAFVIRSNVSGSPVEKRILQQDWNQDTLLGNSEIRTVLNIENRQIVLFEYEWYGAGIAELKFVIDDHPISAHKEFHANRQPDVWMGTPFLPLRVEIENISATSGTSTIRHGSNSVMLEGSAGKLGITSSVASPTIGTSMQSANEWYPILSIRLEASRLNAIVLPTHFHIATADNVNIFYRVVRNADLSANQGIAWEITPAGGSAFTEWQYYVNPVSILDINQGAQVDTGFVSGGGSGSVALDRDNLYQIARNGMGTVSDTLTILCASSVANKDALAAITWIEQR